VNDALEKGTAVQSEYKQAEEQERSRRLDEQLLVTERREFLLRILETKCNHAGK
jgi:hypothetical protein